MYHDALKYRVCMYFGLQWAASVAAGGVGKMQWRRAFASCMMALWYHCPSYYLS